MIGLLSLIAYLSFPPSCLASGEGDCVKDCDVACITPGCVPEKGRSDYLLGIPVCYKCWVPQGPS